MCEKRYNCGEASVCVYVLIRRKLRDGMAEIVGKSRSDELLSHQRCAIRSLGGHNGRTLRNE